jgi:cytochrome c5
LTAAATVLASALWAAAPAVSAGAPGDELPDAPGKKILVRACTTCHDLDEVTKFKGYYNRAQWKDIVVTMREYGATLEDGEVDALADYIASAIGKQE